MNNSTDNVFEGVVVGGDFECELLEVLVECEAVLSQLQHHMPLQGEAQRIMAQGYTGSAIVKARAAIAKKARKRDQGCFKTARP